jgi:hypothetical protein
LPNTLNDVYDKILRQIKKSDVKDTKFILRCMVAAQRPLTVDELAMAYALELGG